MMGDLREIQLEPDMYREVEFLFDYRSPCSAINYAKSPALGPYFDHLWPNRKRKRFFEKQNTID
jgi:hypothetical protein